MPVTPGQVRTHFLHPCALFAHRDEHEVTTILGSCVAVCLMDLEAGLGGINHYMLPLWNGDGLPTPRFGDVAIETLVERMLLLGARKERLAAKVFGGAQVIASERQVFSVGERNVAMAHELLARQGIPILGQSVGGMQGRKIHFNTRSGRVLMAMLNRQGEREGRP